MNIYFFGPPTSNSKICRNYGTVLHLLRQAEIEVFSNQEESILTEELSQIEKSGGMILDKMDAFIIEGSTPSQEIGYFLAYAIGQKKPTLYLCQQSDQTRTIFKYLKTKQAPKFLEIVEYSEKNLEQKLIEFLKIIKAGGIREIPSIKFTLRITPSIERYLHWKTHNTKKSKADFLREDIEDQMKKDEKYQKFLKKK